ncbi:MAG: hypothetical protein KDE56_19295 [Anaerolineales bacterium]|nr:hypothetical protein [Anaerolineales bacterium]
MTVQQITDVMTYRAIPAGQMRLIKPLYEAYPEWLTLEEFNNTSDCSIGSTLGALGNRVTARLGKNRVRSSSLLITQENKQYRLTEDMVSFIRSVPDFERALGSDIQRFFRHTPEAFSFIWNTDKTGGELQQFRRD